MLFTSVLCPFLVSERRNNFRLSFTAALRSCHVSAFADRPLYKISIRQFCNFRLNIAPGSSLSTGSSIGGFLLAKHAYLSVSATA